MPPLKGGSFRRVALGCRTDLCQTGHSTCGIYLYLDQRGIQSDERAAIDLGQHRHPPAGVLVVSNQAVLTITVPGGLPVLYGERQGGHRLHLRGRSPPRW